MSKLPFTHVALSEIAEVRFSSVDKHTVAGEKAVRLCNYTDVFKNRFIADSMNFMTASATESEIERFGLRHGDIAITKDSETPEEIGIPALVERPSPDLVLGYHLALIRAKADRCDPYFLAAAMQSRHVARHYLRTAVGLTRFGLSIKAVADTPVPNIPLSTQRKIGRWYREAARLESHTDALIAAKREQKRGLMQQLLTGKVRFPGFTEPWKTVRLEQVASLRNDKTIPSRKSQIRCIELEHIGQGTGEVMGSAPASSTVSLKTAFQPGDVLFGKLRPYLKKFALVDFAGCCSTEIWALVADQSAVTAGYLRLLVESTPIQRSANATSGTKMPRADWDVVAATSVQLPPLSEQCRITAIIGAIESELRLLQQQRTALATHRRGLMERLLSGDIALPSSDTSAA